MSFLKPFKKVRPGQAKGDKLSSHQKACPKCGQIVHVDMERCPACGHAPWAWHPNVRFLVITVIIAAFLLILIPMLTTNDKSYRTPVTPQGP